MSDWSAEEAAMWLRKRLECVVTVDVDGSVWVYAEEGLPVACIDFTDFAVARLLDGRAMPGNVRECAMWIVDALTGEEE